MNNTNDYHINKDRQLGESLYITYKDIDKEESEENNTNN